VHCVNVLYGDIMLVDVECREFLWCWRKHENRGRITGHVLKWLYPSWELQCSRTL